MLRYFVLFSVGLFSFICGKIIQKTWIKQLSNNKKGEVREDSISNVELKKLIKHGPERLKHTVELVLSGKKPPADIQRLQYPTFFRYPDIIAEEWHNNENYDWVDNLENNWQRIYLEFQEMMRQLDQELTVIPSSNYGGKWSTLDLYNQGKKNERNCNLCPITTQLIENIHMANNGLCYVYFSVIEEGTHITKHAGPSNIKLRCHLGLEIPTGAKMRVGREWRQWNAGNLVLQLFSFLKLHTLRCLIFDDSFEHEVINDGPGTRIVLLIDIWNPDLSKLERDALNLLLPVE